MPLTPYRRGLSWWAKGRIEYNGRPITAYVRSSTGASDEAGAWDWIQAETQRQIRRHLFGEDTTLTFDEAVLLYPAKPAEARFLLKILPLLGHLRLTEIKPGMVRDIAPEIYPEASTDTWRRQVLTPVSAVINRAHDKGHCPPIRIKGYSSAERLEQDARRGKRSRPDKVPGDWRWIHKIQPFCNPYVAAGLEFMFETGCRIGQLVAVTPDDLDLPQARVRLIAQKGHGPQWVAISTEMVVKLANLPARRPHNRKAGYKLSSRVFGYGDRTGFTTALRRACAAAGVDYRPPHQAGRHGYYTELRVRQGLAPHDVAQAGRWSNPGLPERTYAHSDVAERKMREQIRAANTSNRKAKK